MKQIEIKIQRGQRKRIKSAPCFSLTASSELVMHIVIDSYSWPSQYLSRGFPGLGQGYLGRKQHCSVFLPHFSLQHFLLCAQASTKRTLVERRWGTYTLARCDAFKGCSQCAWNRGEFGSLATYPPPSHPHVKWQGWLIELELGSNLTAALSGSALLAATAPARARWSRERKGGPKKGWREKKKRVSHKNSSSKMNSPPKSYFFIS